MLCGYREVQDLLTENGLTTGHLFHLACCSTRRRQVAPRLELVLRSEGFRFAAGLTLPHVTLATGKGILLTAVEGKSDLRILLGGLIEANLVFDTLSWTNPHR